MPLTATVFPPSPQSPPHMTCHDLGRQHPPRRHYHRVVTLIWHASTPSYPHAGRRGRRGSEKEAKLKMEGRAGTSALRKAGSADEGCAPRRAERRGRRGADKAGAPRKAGCHGGGEAEQGGAPRRAGRWGGWGGGAGGAPGWEGCQGWRGAEAGGAPRRAKRQGGGVSYK